MNFEGVLEIARGMPDVSDATSARGLALKLNGKLLACKAINKSAEPNSLMIRIGGKERDRLLAAHPKDCYLTEHYRSYPALLVRLDKVSRKTLKGLLTTAWQQAQE